MPMQKPISHFCPHYAGLHYLEKVKLKNYVHRYYTPLDLECSSLCLVNHAHKKVFSACVTL